MKGIRPVKLSTPKQNILLYLATVKRATIYHYTNARELMDNGSKGNHKLRGIAKHFNELNKQGHIIKSHQDLDSIYGGIYRTQYYELSEKSLSALEVPKDRTFSVTYPHIQHQYGLMTSITSVYLNNPDKQISVDYACKDYGYAPDAVMNIDGKKIIIECERSKGVDELVEEMEKRDKLVNDATFIYTIACTFSKNKSSVNQHTVKPIELYDRYNPQERRVEEFVDALMPKIKHLPSWKYKIVELHNFDKFDTAIFRKPGKKELFRLN